MRANRPGPCRVSRWPTTTARPFSPGRGPALYQPALPTAGTTIAPSRRPTASTTVLTPAAGMDIRRGGAGRVPPLAGGSAGRDCRRALVVAWLPRVGRSAARASSAGEPCGPVRFEDRRQREHGRGGHRGRNETRQRQSREACVAGAGRAAAEAPAWVPARGLNSNRGRGHAAGEGHSSARWRSRAGDRGRCRSRWRGGPIRTPRRGGAGTGGRARRARPGRQGAVRRTGSGAS